MHKPSALSGLRPGSDQRLLDDLKKSVEAVKAMPPDERAAMLDAQAKSYARAEAASNEDATVSFHWPGSDERACHVFGDFQVAQPEPVTDEEVEAALSRWLNQDIRVLALTSEHWKKLKRDMRAVLTPFLEERA